MKKLFKILIYFGALLLPSCGLFAQPLFDHVSITGADDYSFNAGSTSTYDSTTDLLSVVSSGEIFTFNGGPVYLSGSLDLNAIIDETGSLISGSLTWVGGSDDLGIAYGTSLLTGTVIGTDIVDVGAGILHHFLIEVTSSHASLGLGKFVGFGTEQVLEYTDGSIYHPGDNPYIKNFIAGPYSVSFLGNVEVPEPPLLLLIIMGLLGMSISTKLKRTGTC